MEGILAVRIRARVALVSIPICLSRVRIMSGIQAQRILRGIVSGKKVENFSLKAYDKVTHK